MAERDDQLWMAWRNDADGTAFAALVCPHLDLAVDLARRAGCGPADADEVVQRCLVRLASEVRDTPVRVGVRAWLGRSVLSETVTFFRERRRRATHEARAGRSVPEGREPLESADEVSAALAAAEPNDRRLLELRFLHDLEYREVAFILDCSPLAARLRVHRALSRLRSRLGRSAPLVIATLPRLPGARSSEEAVAGAARAAASARGLGSMARAGLVGGAIVTISTKAVVATVVALGVGGWWLWGRGGSGDVQPVAPLVATATPDPAAPAPGLAASPRQAPPARERAPTAPSAPTLLPAVSGKIAGVVVDGRARPVEGCRVWVAAKATTGAMGPPSAEGRTSPTGAFVVASTPGAALADLWAYALAPGHLALCAPVAGLPRDERGYILALASGGSLAGRVVDSKGAGLAETRVQVRGRGAEDLGWAVAAVAWSPGLTPNLAEAVTDGEGRFRFEGLRDVTYEVVAAKSGYAARLEGGVGPSVRPDGTDGPTLVLDPLYGIAVYAVDDEDGSVLPSAEFGLMMQPGHPWSARSEPADASGPFPSLREYATTRAAHGVRQEFVLAPEGDASSPVMIEPYAPGYASVRLRIVPVPLRDVQPTTARLKRSGATASVTLRCSWTQPPLPSGAFLLDVMDAPGPRRVRRLQVTLIDGRSTVPIALPIGRHPVSLRGSGGGSAVMWTDPLGTEERGRPRDAWIEVQPGADAEIVLEFQGGGLVVAPRSADGASILHYRLVRDGDGLSTWETLPRLDRLRVGDVEGFVFWMSPGSHDLTVWKSGFQATKTTLVIPSNGSIVT